MTKQEYYDIRGKMGILEQVGTFLKYVRNMREIYPQFKQMTLEDIYMYLKQRETALELEIQKDLNVI